MEERRNNHPSESSAERLDSWKEIASFLKKSVRTVQRWEVTENLPVRRHHHEKKGTVYAYKGELELWFSRRAVRVTEPSIALRLGPEGNAGQMPSPAHGHLTESLEAYRHYLQGRKNLELRTKAGLEKGIQCFNRAIQEDCGFGLALAGVADCWNMLGFHSFIPPNVAFPKASAAATEALRRSGDSAEVRASLGFTALFYDWDRVAAAASFEGALRIKPDYAQAHYWYGLNLAALGRPYDAIQQIRRAQELDPLSPLINTYVAGAFYFARHFEEAEEKCRFALEMDPRFALARLVLGWTLRAQSRFDQALEEFRNASGPDYVDALAALGHCLGLAGRRQEARRVLNELLEMKEESFVSSGHLAMVLLGLGDHEAALRRLTEAYRERYSWLVFLKLDPVFDPLRRYEEFSDLQRLVGI